MDRTPPEILSLIASHLLELADLANFRLVARKFASPAYPFLSRHLSVVNTLSYLDGFHKFTRSSGTNPYTERLTIYHGNWPVCTQEEWAIHPLQTREIYPKLLSQFASSPTYQDYHDFITAEGRRDHVADLGKYRQILSLLPNVKVLSIRHLQSRGSRSHSNQKYLELRKKIGLSPSLRTSVDVLVQELLSELDGFPGIREVEIQGRFDPAPLALRDNVTISNVARLEIKSLQFANSAVDKFISLMAAFPNLEELSLTFIEPNSYADIPIDRVHWLKLHTLFLKGLWVSDDSLLSLVEQSPNLKDMNLSNITLTSGNWESLFSRLRSLGKDIHIVPDGWLDGLDPGCVYILVDECTRFLLSRFLADRILPWPFARALGVQTDPSV